MIYTEPQVKREHIHCTPFKGWIQQGTPRPSTLPKESKVMSFGCLKMCNPPDTCIFKVGINCLHLFGICSGILLPPYSKIDLKVKRLWFKATHIIQTTVIMSFRVCLTFRRNKILFALLYTISIRIRIRINIVFIVTVQYFTASDIRRVRK